MQVSTIVVTHDMVSAYKVSDRIIMLHEGRVVYSGTPTETQNATVEIVHKFVTGEADTKPYVITRY